MLIFTFHKITSILEAVFIDSIANRDFYWVVFNLNTFNRSKAWRLHKLWRNLTRGLTFAMTKRWGLEPRHSHKFLLINLCWHLVWQFVWRTLLASEEGTRTSKWENVQSVQIFTSAVDKSSVKCQLLKSNRVYDLTGLFRKTTAFTLRYIQYKQWRNMTTQVTWQNDVTTWRLNERKFHFKRFNCFFNYKNDWRILSGGDLWWFLRLFGF